MIVALRVIWRVLRLSLHLLVGIVLTLLLSRRDKRNGRHQHNPYVVSWWHDRLLRILKVEVEVIGHRPQPPALMVSNHISWLDVPVLLSLCHTAFLAKSEIRDWPLIGWLAETAGTLFIRRGAGEANNISQSFAQRLDEEGLLTLFPEGTTTDGSDVRPFFPRLFASAIETGAPVAPVALRYHRDGVLDTQAAYTGKQSLAENLWIIIRRPRTQVRVAFTPCIRLAGLERKAAAEQARRAILDALHDPALHKAGETRTHSHSA